MASKNFWFWKNFNRRKKERLLGGEAAKTEKKLRKKDVLNKKDVKGYVPSKHVPFKHGEGFQERHNRRLLFNLGLENEIRRWCDENNIRFEITNSESRFAFRFKGGTIDWWPSTAKLIINRKWDEGYHIYDWEQAREVIGDLKDATIPKIEAIRQMLRQGLPPKKKKPIVKVSSIRERLMQQITKFSVPKAKLVVKRPQVENENNFLNYERDKDGSTIEGAGGTQTDG